MSLLLTVAFASALLEVSGLHALTIQVSVAKPDVLVGESTKIISTWSVTQPVTLNPQKVEVLLDQGAGFDRWYEASAFKGAAVTGPLTLTPDADILTEHPIGVGVTRSLHYVLAFPREHTYRVMLRYRSGEDVAQSNVVTIRAVAPTGAAAELFARIRSQPEILLGIPTVRGHPDVMERLFEEYGDSEYLARAKVTHFEWMLARAIADAPDPDPPTGPVQGDVPRLLARLVGDRLGDNPFEPDRLHLLGQMSTMAGRPDLASGAFREVASRFPNTRAGRYAKRHPANN